MAQRYGGEFSPKGAPNNAAKPGSAFRGAMPARAGARVNFLFFAPLPLALRAFWQEPAGLATMLGAFGVLILAAWLTRDGLRAEEAYHARKVARRPALPRKLIGSALTGIGLWLAATATMGGFFGPILLGVVGALLHCFSFGIDPMSDKGAEGIDTFQADRVARAVEGAEGHLTAISDAILRTRDRALEARVARFAETARDMFRTVENDPRDLTAARKYLGVYLKGARDATVKFTAIYERNGDAKARADYEALLNDLEQNFAARTEVLLTDDKTDLDVEIDVLRDRIAREIN